MTEQLVYDYSTMFNDELYSYSALVTSVYDADTITCDIDLGFGVILKKQKIRLFGIDAPEMRGDEREEGIKSRNFLRSLILDKDILLKTMKNRKGKYGRWIGLIYQSDNSGKPINYLLIEKGYAIYTKY